MVLSEAHVKFGIQTSLLVAQVFAVMLVAPQAPFFAAAIGIAGIVYTVSKRPDKGLRSMAVWDRFLVILMAAITVMALVSIMPAAVDYWTGGAAQGAANASAR